MLEAVEQARVRRETMDARNAAARRRRARSASAGAGVAEVVAPRPLPVLFLRLPGVVSWARPREQPLRGGGRRMAYPERYQAGRLTWGLAVRAAVVEASWARPPVGVALSLVASIVAPGKLDTDRVVTAVLDALQAGGALVDDCRVWHLQAERRRPGPGEDAHVDVMLSEAPVGPLGGARGTDGTAVLE